MNIVIPSIIYHLYYPAISHGWFEEPPRRLRFHLSRVGQLRRAFAQLEDAHRRAGGLAAHTAGAKPVPWGAMGQRLDGETDGKTGENDAKTWKHMGKWWENLGTLEQIMGL